MLKIHKFFNRLTNRFDLFIRVVRTQHCFLGDFGEHSFLFRSYLPHKILELCNIFFWSPYSSGNIMSKFHNFPQPDRPVGIQFNRFVESAYAILEPKSLMDLDHMLQIGLGQYFASILGFSLSYMQPTMNPC